MTGLRVVDTFCGAGGFSEGFRQAGFDVVLGIDNWGPARRTHEANGLGESLNIDLLKLSGKGGWNTAKHLAQDIERKYGKIDVLIGSPPCTEFSYAKNGGKGDIAKGMLLVRAHLLLAAALRPTFWMMENVPRLETVLNSEGEVMSDGGWRIPLSRLDITRPIENVPWMDDEYYYINYGAVYDSSVFSSPQKRRRFIAGNLSYDAIMKNSVKDTVTMQDCISSLDKQRESKSRWIHDPNYPFHKVERNDVGDLFYNTSLHPMYWEEIRHLKRRHIQYGRMKFPDKLDQPSRTVMATFNASSRESIILDTGKKITYQKKTRPIFRQLTVREVACLQGFPLDFHLVARSLSSRHKLVGNAVPCHLSYAIARAALQTFDNAIISGTISDEGLLGRFYDTRERAQQSGAGASFRPIINRSVCFHTDEARDFKAERLSTLRARPDKHIRRKILSSKPRRRSAIVIFENTVFPRKKRGKGETWKVCVQRGIGKRFHQVFIDEVSVRGMLQALDSRLQDPVKKGRRQNRIDTNGHLAIHDKDFVKELVKTLIIDMNRGIPIVPEEWIEFPGYRTKESKKYLEMISSERRRLPSSSELQMLFTTDSPDIGNQIGPLDLFDGIDAIMLKHLGCKDTTWIIDTSIKFSCLKDRGEEYYPGRISDSAIGTLNGDLPLVTILAALISTVILSHMHELDDCLIDDYSRSLRKGADNIKRWCDYQSK